VDLSQGNTTLGQANSRNLGVTGKARPRDLLRDRQLQKIYLVHLGSIYFKVRGF
jgi:hypothetical protein